MDRRYQQQNKIPPSSSGSRFQRSNTSYGKAGGYDTYGTTNNRDPEEEEDYRNYRDAQRRDDPWSKSGGKKRDHSIGSDFDNEGNVKKDEPKSPEQIDFFDMGGNTKKEP